VALRAAGHLGLALAIVGLASSARAEVLVVGRHAATVQATIERASDGDVVEIPAGTYAGPIRVARAITLRGVGATLDGGGRGTVLRVEAPGVVVEGLTVRASGSDVGAPDACIYTTPRAVGVVLRDNRLEDCAFGIWVHMTEGAKVIGNQVRGRSQVRTADRGNGIQLFDASHLEVRGNYVTGARDGIYVSACEDSVIEDNVLEHQRYGLHYMYSYRNTIRGNVARHNHGAFALMQSGDLVVVGNLAEDNEVLGLLFRDAQRCEVRDNTLVRSGEGMFFFSSTDNVIVGNRIVHNDVGAKVWAGSLRNRVEENAFVGNRQQVFYVGAEDQVWGEDGRGNFWSDYLGWDQNGDGIGDRPYRVDSFTANLLHGHPASVFLLRSPILELLSQLEQKMPFLRVPTVVDVAPIVGRTS